MTQKESIKLFEEKKVRTVWDDEREKWYFAIVDVVAVLTDSKDPSAYWRKLKQRLKEEGNETVTNCHSLKMRALDGKMRLTDVADTDELFRIIQSIPSPKAEPFKQWMAEVASLRLEQMQDPELSTTSISKAKNPQGLDENAQCAAEGGNVSAVARKELEAKIGRKVVSPLNAKRFFEDQLPEDV